MTRCRMSNTCLLCQQFLIAGVNLSGSFTSAGSMQCAAAQAGVDGVVVSGVPGRTSSRRLAQFAAAAEDPVLPSPSISPAFCYS
jgi:hypothetical protein